MKKLHPEEKNNIILLIGCWLAFTLTSLTKSNYTASVAYIVSQGIFSKTNAGTISSAFYAFYGIGQMLGGRIVDKYSPYHMITLGVLGALISNLILCFTANYWIVIVVWSFSGCIQFGVYPGVCRIIATEILPEFRQRANIYLQYGLPLSSLFSYFLSMTLLEYFGWSAMFISSTLALFATLFVWQYAKKRRPDTPLKQDIKMPAKAEQKREKTPLLPLLFSSGLLFMLFVTFSDSLLNNGAQVWIPTMIMESYSVSSAFASMQTIFLLIIQIVGLSLIKPLLKNIRNPITGKCLLVMICLVPLIILQFIGKIPLWMAVVMLSMTTLFIKVSGIFGMQLIVQIGQFGYSGTYAGLTNALTSFGIVIASTGYGIISGHFGWSAITASWLILSAISIIFCIPAIYMWKKTLIRLEVNQGDS